MKLIIPAEIEQKIHDYVCSVESEIAGMGSVTIGEDGNATVEEVMIYEQEVTGGTADLSSQAIARWQSELVRAGGSPKKWRLWWHSHNTMAAFFSKRDTDTIDDSNEADWMISLVVNKKREREARLDLYRPFRVKLEKLEIKIEGGIQYALPAAIIAEVAEKVKRPPAIVTPARTFYAPAKAPAGFHYEDQGMDTPRTRVDVIELHRYCPKHTSGGVSNECYHPYGEIKNAIYADCSTKKFKKVYGKKPFMVEREVPAPATASDKAQVMAIINELDKQIHTLEVHGRGETPECIDLLQEKSDWYYQLADMEANDNIAENIRAEAAILEDTVFFARGNNRTLL